MKFDQNHIISEENILIWKRVCYPDRRNCEHNLWRRQKSIINIPFLESGNFYGFISSAGTDAPHSGQDTRQERNTHTHTHTHTHTKDVITQHMQKVKSAALFQQMATRLY